MGVEIRKTTSPRNYDYYDKNYYKKSEHNDFTKTPVYRHLSEAFNHRKIVTFLDIGCGIGNQIKAFKRMSSDMVGIDISISALRKAKMASPSENFILADAKSLPVRDQCIDAGICISLIEHLEFEEGKRVLREIHRASRRNALFAIITPKSDSLVYEFGLCHDLSHVHLYTADKLRDILTSIGFNIKQLLFSSMTTKLRPVNRLLKCDMVFIVQRVAQEESSSLRSASNIQYCKEQ